MPNPTPLETIESLLQTLRTSKQAAEEPTTTHPVGKAPDSTTDATEGARSAENEKDVKAQVPSSVNVDVTPAANSTKDQGTAVQGSDETKGNVATPGTTPDKPDESASHPSNQTFNEKYASWQKQSGALLETLTKLAEAIADPAVLPAIAETAEDKKKKEAKKEETKEETKEEAEKEAAQQVQDAQAGYLAAATTAMEMGLITPPGGEEKIAELVKRANEDAANVVDYVNGCYNQMSKLAAGEEVPPEVMAAMSGGVPADASAMPGAAPEAPGAPAAPGGDDPAVEELVNALEQLGVTPEELAEAVASEASGGASPEAPATPAEPPAEAAKAAALQKKANLTHGLSAFINIQPTDMQKLAARDVIVKAAKRLYVAKTTKS